MTVEKRDELVAAELAHGKAIGIAIATAAERGDDALSQQTKAFHMHTMDQACYKPVEHKIEIMQASLKPFETFTARVSAMPKFTPSELEDAQDASQRIAGKVKAMQTALNDKKPIVVVAMKREAEAEYNAALKKFADKEEAFHYMLHTALDAVKPEDNHRSDAYVHRFEHDVVALLPEPIRPMGKHGRFSHYGLAHDAEKTNDGQASLWGYDVQESRLKAVQAGAGKA
jgi:hypothetical protein